MSEGVDEELRVLRERAYGPKADIHDDPSALARLHELEITDASTKSAPRTHGDDVQDLAASDRAAEEPSEPEHVDSVVQEAAPAEEVVPATAPRDGLRLWRWTLSRRRVMWLWAGSLVVALVAGAAIWSAVMQPRGHVATLEEDSTTPWLEDYFGARPDGARMTEEFHGIVAVVMPDGWMAGAETPCMYLALSDRGRDSQSNVVLDAACTAGSFPATVAVLVSEGMPQDLLDHYDVGTALAFVLTGDAVEVYADGGAG
ncbi:hypothetical protein ACFQZV_00550 [Microbacterium koreense]|uniref:Uncharacterized protein n=1 Tax=Microbacterium koreense TaxID=323761 RepID=A0ABW2ZMR3_9MICO